jgi:hypothetical protein
MSFMFGPDETLTCIAPVKLKGGNGEALCIGYKTTKFAIFAPAYLKDDGYVLIVQNNSKNYYPMPQGAELADFQSAGTLPTPLPSYTIPTIEYVFGYLLWIALGITALLSMAARALKKRRHESLQTFDPPATDAPSLRTKTDRWLADEAKKLLEPGEAVQHQAYGADRDLSTGTVAAMRANAYYALLTNRRLLFIRARIGAFGPLRENRGVDAFPRETIETVQADERHLRFVFKDGNFRDFFAEWSERKLSNQKRFLRDVPRLVGHPQAAAAVSFA